MRVLIACESSGVVRDAFAARGHEAWSVDFQECDKGPESGLHHTGDVLEVLGHGFGAPFDLMIAHPPCTYLSSSGMHWTTRGLRDPQLTEDALEFVRKLWAAPVPRICIENPQGIISTRLGIRAQYVQPYEFGDDASKRTGLFLKGLPPLVPTIRMPGRIVSHNGKQVERWSNQTDSGQNRLGPSPDRWKERSRTLPGIARAMAEQWGGICGI